MKVVQSLCSFQLTFEFFVRSHLYVPRGQTNELSPYIFVMYSTKQVGAVHRKVTAYVSILNVFGRRLSCGKLCCTCGPPQMSWCL